jgi:hypothetical protein
VWVALLESGQLKSLPQISDALPAVSPLPLRDKLEDTVDRLALGRWPAFDAGDKQPIKLRQPPEVFVGPITLSIDSLLP